MAISTLTTWEVRPTNGNDTNGGGFVQGSTGTDYSQQNAKNSGGNNGSTTDAVANGTTTITSASASFTSALVGNIIYLSGGSGSLAADRYEVKTFTNSTTIVVDRNVATGTGITMNIGGALKTLSQLNTSMNAVNGNSAWVKAESTITTASTITFNFTGASSAQQPAVKGYATTRGDGGKVTIQVSSSTGDAIVNINSAGLSFENFILDGNSKSSQRGLILNTTGCRAVSVDVKNCTNVYGIELDGNYCSAVDCTVTGQGGSSGSHGAFRFSGVIPVFLGCVAYGNSVGGFVAASSQGSIHINCIAANNSGASSDGFFVGGAQPGCTLFLMGCVAYANGRDGIRFSVGQQSTFQFRNTITYGNSGWGINQITSTIPAGTLYADYNAYGSNTSGNLSGISAGAHDQTLSGDPFTNGAGNVFTLNSTAGAGAACRAAGFPSLSTFGTGYPDIGALQHQDAGGSTTYVIAQNRTQVVLEGEI